MKKLLQAAGLGLMIPALTLSGGQGLTKAEKDSLLSRKQWYVSYSFSVSGQGGTQGSNWRTSMQSGGVVALNHAIPGQWPLSTVVTPDIIQQTGRFITWMTMPTDETYRRMEAGETNPARLEGMYYPFERQTDVMKSSRNGNVWREDTWRGAGTGYAVGPCTLAFDLEQGTYDLVFTVGPTDQGANVRHVWRGSENSGEDAAVPTHFTAWFANSFMPQLARRRLRDDLKADGTLRFGFQGPIKLSTGPSGNDNINFIANFILSPKPPSTAKLVLEPADAAKYRAWRPRPGKNEDLPGNSLGVKYTVEEPGVPAAQQAKVTKVTLRLGNVSRYPGVCMNFPLAPSGAPKLDLKFKPVADTPTVEYSMGVDDQSVAISGPSGAPRSGSLEVECFDGAAIGEVVAEAELADGRILTAEVRGQTASRKLLIPDREEGVSDLPKAWRAKWAPGMADNDDSENEPVGDGQPGDGLTVWEEYRGFRQGGIWRDNCEPKKKDLFIVNKIGAAAKAGIRLFKSATGLLVHDELQEKEYFSDRRINFNVRADRHIVDQHFLFLTRSPHANKGRCEAMLGKPMGGPPKNTLRVDVLLGLPGDMVYGLRPSGAVIVQNQQSVMIAHELCHGIGVYHHGDVDQGYIDWTLSRAGAEAQVLEAANIIRVVEEPAALPLQIASLFAPGANTTQVWVGQPQGQHSGHPDCFMRYDTSTAYALSRSPQTRVYHKGRMETTGELLCSSPAGTGINGPSNLPQSRYGEAGPQRGDCIHQFVISDRWEAKVR